MQNPINQRSDNEATQAPILTKPKRRKLQAMEIGLDLMWAWFLTAAPVEEKNMLEWRVESGFDLFWVLYLVLFMGFWGLEVESGMASGESKKRKGRTRKLINS